AGPPVAAWFPPRNIPPQGMPIHEVIMITKNSCTYSCRLTCLFCLFPGVSGGPAFLWGGLAGGVPGCFPLVLRAFRAAGAGLAGFRGAGGSAERFADAAESGADLAGGHLGAGLVAGVP